MGPLGHVFIQPLNIYLNLCNLLRVWFKTKIHRAGICPDYNTGRSHRQHYIPERRGLEFDTIEDAIPLYDAPVSKCATPPDRVYLVPSEEPVAFDYEGGYMRLVIPEVHGHQMIVAE